MALSLAYLTSVLANLPPLYTAFFFAHRARCASAIFARDSADTVRFFLRGFITRGLSTACGIEPSPRIPASSLSSF